MKTLTGDRAIEWGFVKNQLPDPGHGFPVLDFGPMEGFALSWHALGLGYQVVAVGLEHIVPPPGITYHRQDILTWQPDPPQFDYILNASTVEHVGLERYGDPPGANFDLLTMRKLRAMMHPQSFQYLTIPIGQDAVVEYWHRVYGEERLPALLGGYKVLEEQYHIKTDDDSAWVPCSKERALMEIPGLVPEPSMLNLSYALGCLVLCLA